MNTHELVISRNILPFLNDPQALSMFGQDNIASAPDGFYLVRSDPIERARNTIDRIIAIYKEYVKTNRKANSKESKLQTLELRGRMQKEQTNLEREMAVIDDFIQRKQQQHQRCVMYIDILQLDIDAISTYLESNVNETLVTRRRHLEYNLEQYRAMTDAASQEIITCQVTLATLRDFLTDSFKRWVDLLNNLDETVQLVLAESVGSEHIKWAR